MYKFAEIRKKQVSLWLQSPMIKNNHEENHP